MLMLVRRKGSYRYYWYLLLEKFNILVIFRFDCVGGNASVNLFCGPCDLYRLNWQL
jgi:hypothetical protein